MKKYYSLLIVLLLIALLPTTVMGAQAGLMPIPKAQFADVNGVPYNGGKLYTCKPGTTCGPTTTTNLKSTYTDSTGSTANTNPVVLDSSGRANVWLLGGYYKMSLYNSAGTLVWSVDNISTYIPAYESTYDALLYGDGSYSSATLMAACTAVGANYADIAVRPGTWTFTSNVNFYATCPNATFKIYDGAKFSYGAYTVSMTVPDAGRHLLYDGSGSVKLYGPGDEVKAEWFPNSAVGLQLAIDSVSSTTNQTVSIGTNSTIDITNGTVTLRNGTTLKGISRVTSKINMSGGSISFGTYNTTSSRWKRLYNLNITNAVDTSYTVDLTDVTSVSGYGPYESIIEECTITGGLASVAMKNVAAVQLVRNHIVNDKNSASIYAVYLADTLMSTSIAFDGNRISGKVNILGVTGYGVSGLSMTNQNIIEAAYGYCLTMNYVNNFSFTGAYFESTADIPIVVIGYYTFGGSITGGHIWGSVSNTSYPLQIDGDSITVENCNVAYNANNDTVYLTSNSRRCKVGPLVQYKTIKNSGLNNITWPSGQTTRSVTTVTTSGTNAATLFTHSIRLNTFTQRMGLEMSVSGLITGTAGNHTFTLTVGSTTQAIYNSTAAGNFRVYVWMEVESSTAQRIHYEMFIGTSLVSLGYVRITEDMTVDAKKFSLTGQCANSGDAISAYMGKASYK